MKTEPVLYGIGFRENYKWNCVGCRILIQERIGDGTRIGGYVANPKIDLTGIENNSDLVRYNIVTLPPILSASDDRMVSIDNGDDLGNFYKDFYKPDDTFWLNSETFDKTQCADHPKVGSAGYTEESRLNTAQNGDLHTNKHQQTMFPPIFGRSQNAQTEETETLLFDPTMAIFENSLDQPMADGGGKRISETNGKTICSNAPKTFQNEEHCK